MTTPRPIRVLVVDDSPVLRAAVRAVLEADPEIRVVGEAEDGEAAVRKVRELTPDLVTMDVRMPRLDGLQAIRRILAERPTPIIIVTSSTSDRELNLTFNGLRAGALAVIGKPRGPQHPKYETEARDLIRQVKTYAGLKLVRRRPTLESAPPAEPVRVRPAGQAEVIALACSTGGPAALHRLLGHLSHTFPAPVLVVQHMSRGFIQGLAQWLDGLGSLPVRVAQEGEPLAGGCVLFAPDGVHLTVNEERRIRLRSGRPVDGHLPSASVLFDSVAGAYGAQSLAVVLTGMGQDGVSGLRALRQAGGRVLAQDEASSVVYGMPGAAVREGLVDEVLPLDEIPARMTLLTAPGGLHQGRDG